MGVYLEYFQKSKVFLYPLLEIKKGITRVPIQTYVAWDNVYSTNYLKFLCVYTTKKNPKFNSFVNNNLMKHSLLEEVIELKENKHLFIYDFTKFKSDYKKFLEGKYSQYSLNSKISIIDFFGTQKKIGSYVEGFLTPEGVHEEYAEFLGVDIKSVEDIYEVCTPPDLTKEMLIDNNHVINQLLKNSSISLTNK
jgi:hypothetical protein